MLRWTIAAASCLGLAILTLNADPGLPFHFGASTTSAGAPAGAACPANAKAANLNFTLKDVDNKDVQLASFKGKVVLLDFWATWCGPCKIEIPWFIEFQKKYGKDGLQVVGVSVDDTVDKLKPYVANARMNYVVLQGLDHDEVQDAFGPMFGIPVTAIISRDGRICAKHVGLSSKDAFENEIKSLL
jgi:cytochrome c biogenesis protein CcmG/thiol:disulfide interchange protein DsbE